MQERKYHAPSFFPFLLAILVLVGQFFLMWFLPRPEWLNHSSSLRWLQNILAWGVWSTSMYFLFAPVFILRSRGGVARKASYVETQKLVTGGLYGVVRHPQYLGWLLMYLAMICFNPHFLCLVCGICGMGLMILITHLEDRHLVEKFGNAYRRYKSEVPALNLFLGLLRLRK